MKNLDELKQVFFIECAELLSDMEERLLKLDEGTQDKEPLNAIFRCAHSIKGGSGAFGLDAVMQFTHTMEALLDIMRDGKALATREAIDLLLKAADIVSRMLAAAKAGQAIAEGMGNEVKAGLQRLTRGAGAASYAPPPPQAAVANPAASGECEYDIVFSPRSGLFERGNEPLLILRELDKMGNMQVEIDTAKIPPFDEFDPAQIKLSWTIKLQTQHPESLINEVFEFVQDLADIRITAVRPMEAAGPKTALPAKKEGEAPAAEATHVKTTPSIRVDLEKVDKLVNMVGELVITEAMIRAQMRHLPPEHSSRMQSGVDELSHHARELQEAVMSVRMQPVKSIFSRMPRIVRDTAALLGKEIQL